MKFGLIFIAVLPFTLGARLNERFLESLTGGVDFLSLATQVLSQCRCEETEPQCELTACQSIVNKLDFGNHLITNLVCTTVCHQAQLLAKEFTSGSVLYSGVDPCPGSSVVGR